VLKKFELPDIGQEVACFLRGYDRLVGLPLISDAEVDGLFSPILLQTLAQLRQYDQNEQICAACSERCCALIRCELYDPALGVCPAFNLRPLLCRMHYCHKFEAHSKAIKVIGDIFLESLLAAERQGSRKTALFDSPSLAPAAPILAENILTLRTAFREGKLGKAAALTALQAAAENYRMVGRD